jgi:catechol 2,3-dioxygenase-like lactoylglutathione lyase family enzyme
VAVGELPPGWGPRRKEHVKVKRIVANIATPDVTKAAVFYERLLGLEIIMDLGWIRTYGANSRMQVQVGMMSEGGSGTPVPDLSIEVDDIKEVFVRDPFGKLINILQHE